MWYDSKHIKILEPKEWYNLIAKEYNQYHDHLTSFDKWFFLTLLPRDSKNLDLIDLGAWDGRIYNILQRQNYEFHTYTACDISEKLLANHKWSIKKVVCDLEQALLFWDQSFDLAFSFFVLEHIADLDHLFMELERILRPGGKRIIGHFLQRREFIWKKDSQWFKIMLYKHRLQDIEKTANQNLLNITNYPVHEKWELVWYIILCEKPV